MGYRVTAQSYRAHGVLSENLDVTCEGQSEPSEIILIGAHYDSVPGSPGANDNACGVAALLEISRGFAQRAPAPSVRFVAFVNEEAPFFYGGQMGSMGTSTSYLVPRSGRSVLGTQESIRRSQIGP